MPSTKDTIANIGEIKFDLFPSPNIQLISFPAKKLFEMYISETILTDMEITLEFR